MAMLGSSNQVTSHLSMALIPGFEYWLLKRGKHIMKNIHTIVVVGLGYVGLPLAHAFSKHFRVIGYDLSEEKIALYRKGIDPTNELGNETVKERRSNSRMTLRRFPRATSSWSLCRHR